MESLWIVLNQAFFETYRKPNLHILCLNVNGVTSKWEKESCLRLFSKYDIVCFSELKCNYVFTLPGFNCVRSRIITGEETRGGVATMFSNKIWNNVSCVTIHKDQVWFKLGFTPEILYGCIYIAPRDSLYFSNESFPHIADKCISNEKILIFGDFNARMSDLSIFSNPDMNITYMQNPDSRSNANGRDLITLCHSYGLLPINHLCYSNKKFHGGLTYRQRDQWISQLDWAISSLGLLENLVDFNIIQKVDLPTNHAPLAVSLGVCPTSSEEIQSRATYLGVSDHAMCNSRTRKPVPLSRVNQVEFTAKIPMTDCLWEQWNTYCDVNLTCELLTDILYNHSNTVKQNNKVANILNPLDSVS